MRVSRLVPIVLSLPLLLLLIRRFSFVCDDAYITFRYAQNLANGSGLRYNPGVDPPVEGYSELLWALLMAVVEGLGWDVTTWSRVLSITVAVALLILVVRFARERVSASPWTVAGAALFFAVLPPVSIWSTGGMATMAFSLAIFVLFDRITGARGRVRTVQAGLAALCVILLRADGICWVALIMSAAAGAAVLSGERSRDQWRPYLPTGLVTLIAAAALVVWRLTYHGALLPNTAQAKVSLTALAHQAGLNYVVVLFLTIPSLLLILVSSLWLLRGRHSLLARQCVLVILGSLAYAILVGGDFMCMGRFLVPAMPFFAVLFGLILDRIERAERLRLPFAAVAVAAGVILSILPAFNVHVTPTWMREAFHFRWNIGGHRTEFEQWQTMKTRAEKWARLGKALSIHTRPGDSLVRSSIGGVGYYSRLFIYDQHGLVSREVVAHGGGDQRKSTGHRKHVTPEFFRPFNPTYCGADLVFIADPSAVVSGWVEDPRLGIRRRIIPLSQEQGFTEKQALLLATWR